MSLSADVPGLTESTEALTIRLHELSLLSARVFNRRVKDIGLTRTQWQVLRLLYIEDGRTQTNLADALLIAKPPLGKVVDRLEADGWVTRRGDAQDRRIKRVYLTAKIEPLLEPLGDVIDDISEAAMAGLSMRERRQLSASLDTLQANLARLAGED